MNRDPGPGASPKDEGDAVRLDRDAREAELRRLLLRSASIDRPSLATRSRSMEATLRRIGALPKASTRRSPWLGLLVAAGMGLVVLSYRFSGRAAQGTQPVQEATRSLPAAHAANPVLGEAKTSLVACPARSSPPGEGLLIDAFEDGDAQLELLDGRSGTWVFSHDETGRTTQPGPLVPSRNTPSRPNSHYALHFSGPRLKLWGASVSSQLAPEKCYDLSAYAGIGFWARGRGRIYLGVPTLSVIPRSRGGTCERGCNNVHRVAIDLSPEWSYRTARWSDLVQLERGTPSEFEPRRAFGLEFMAFAQDTPFDAWIDDVAFIE